MEEPYLTLFTIAVNTLITYFLLRRQEARIAKRAAQDQIKFQMNYPKRVETLEILYKKYEEFFNEVTDWEQVYIRAVGSDEPVDEKIAKEKFDSSYQKLSDLDDYLKANRLNLPDDTLDYLGDLLRDTRRLWGTVRQLTISPDWSKLDPELLEKRKTLFKVTKGKASYGKPITNVPRYLDAINFELYGYARVLEGIYKSIAHVTED